MTRSTGRILRVGLVLILIVLAVNAALSYWSIDRIAEYDRSVAHTREVQAAISEALSTLRDAENGQRGYVITGDSTYLETYRAALESTGSGIDRLGALTADSAVQSARIAAAREHLAIRLDSLEQGVQLRQTRGFEAARDYVRGGYGRREMDALRAIFTAMEAEEDRLLQGRAELARRGYAAAMTTTWVSALASLGLIAIIYAMVGRAIVARARAVALWEADRRKDEFLAILAHELRNPLNAIRAALDSLRLDSRDNPASRRPVEMIDHQVEHVSRLIEDLLDASRIAQGKLELRCEPMDLAEALDLAVEISRPLLDARGQTLSVERSPGPLPVDGDRTRLAQIFANLLGNAAKYSDRGSRVWLESARENGRAVVRVRDEGRGIALEMLPNLFGLYTQEGRLRGFAQGGMGIGLSLVKRLAEMHGGTVQAHSDGPGRGSEFVVRLPISRAQTAPLTAEVAGRPGPPPAPVPPARPRRILLADDNPDIVEMYALMLGARGYEVQVVHDGPDVIEAARVFRPDVVLTDIGLPSLDGFAVAERLRSQPETSGALLIALSGSAREEDRRRALDVGFDNYLTKPVRFATVEELLTAPRRARQAVG